MRDSTRKSAKSITGRAATRMHRAAWLASLAPIMAALATSACAGAEPAENEPEAVAATGQELYTWGLYGWLDNYFHQYGVPPARFSVCWAYIDDWQRDAYANLREWVRSAVTSSWQQNSAVTFTGWDNVQVGETGEAECLATADITIKVQGGCGAVSCAPPGMVWINPNIIGSEQNVRVTAVHEFGHALGFDEAWAQPAGSPEVDGQSCTYMGLHAHGVPTGDWDRQSVMGYWDVCGLGYTHGGRLSETDKIGVQRFYGRPNYFADVTGDGKADAIQVNRSGIAVRDTLWNGGSTNAQWTTFPFFGNYGTYFADVNGPDADGKSRADVIAVTETSINVLLSTGTGFTSPPTGTGFSPSNPELWAWSPVRGKWGTFFADVTGPDADGKSRADAIFVDPERITVRRSTGTRFGDPGHGDVEQWPLSGVDLGNLPVADFLFGDVTGDGKADLVLTTMPSSPPLESGSVVEDYVFVSNGDGFDAGIAVGAFSGTRGTFLADVTGDGKADLIGLNGDGTVVRPAIAVDLDADGELEADECFGPPEPSWSPVPDIENANHSDIVHGIFFADVTGPDGDGRSRADAVRVTDYYIYVHASNGSQFMGQSASSAFPAGDSRGCSHMLEGQALFPSIADMEDGFFSCNNMFQLKLQENGDLELLRNPPDLNAPRTRIWHADKADLGGYIAAMQEDGNFVMYSPSGPIWDTGTQNHPGAYLAVQDDGNLVIRDRSGNQLWASNPCGGTRGPEMQVVSNDDNTVPYCIDKTEVTRAQYKAWLDTNPSAPTGVCSWNTSFKPSGGWRFPGINPDNPVAYVDWCDAYEFCRAANKRLCGKIGGGPVNFSTETATVASQWYNACTSGGLNTFPYGSSYVYGTCNGGGYSGGTVPVGSMTGCQSSVPGSTGVYDLSGNVFEWEDACYGSGDKVCAMRGGTYLVSSYQLTCATALGWGWRSTSSIVGFRCCADLAP